MDEDQKPEDVLEAWIQDNAEVIVATTAIAGFVGFLIGLKVKSYKFDKAQLKFADNVQATINGRGWTRIKVRGRGYDWKITRYLD